MAAFEGRRRRDAAAALRRLVESGAPLGPRWPALARLGMAIGEAQLAIAASGAWVRLEPADRSRRVAHAALLAQLGKVEGAIESLRALPLTPEVDHLLGALHAQIGDAPTALEHLRRAALRLPPVQAVWTWLAAVDIKRFTDADEDYRRIEVLARTPMPDAPQSAAHYALGKALLDLGDTAKAYAHYAEGAAIMARLEPDDGRAQSQFVDALIAGFDGALLGRLKSSTCDNRRPIFVLGPPRSGTTLVEQILTSHSAVSGGAELSLFSVAAMALPDFSPAAVERHDARGGPDPWGEIGRDYLHLLDQRFGATGHVVDKTLNHGRILGLLAKALPAARFVWLDRDIGDVAWSCFRTRFATGMAWTWSLESIGRYLGDEALLRKHWASILGDRLLIHRYEDLVSAPEASTRLLLAHAGLAEEPAVFTPHLQQRAVQTASVSQVRQPIHRNAIGSAKALPGRLEAMYAAYERRLSGT